jgi:hypothetical protein
MLLARSLSVIIESEIANFLLGGPTWGAIVVLCYTIGLYLVLRRVGLA